MSKPSKPEASKIPEDSSPVEIEIRLDELKNPPVVERQIDVRLDLTASHFEDVIPSWLTRVSEERGYPTHRVRKFWHISVERTRESVHPVCKVFEIPRIEESATNGKLKKAIEFVPKIMERPPAIRFIQGRPTKEVTRFETLFEETESLLTDFVENSKLPSVGGVCVRYHDDVSADRYPKLEDGGLFHVGKILRFFQQPSKSEGPFVAPLRGEMTQSLSADAAAFLRFRVEDNSDEKPKIPGVQMFLEYDSALLRGDQSVDAALHEIRQAHILILEEFFMKFDPRALELFQ